MGKHVRQIVVLIVLSMNIPLISQILNAPETLAAALVIKLSSFEKNISTVGEVVIYVLDSPKVAAELEKGIGSSIGQSRLMRVVSGKGLPAEKPNIFYIGNASKLSQALGYTRDKKILSITGMPDLVKEGVTLGVGVGNDGKPKVILNLNSTLQENLSWNPAIMKVARTIQP
jgi:hypothetical protein